MKRITLLEQGALGSGASGRSSAIIRMHYTTEVNARLAVESLPFFTNWMELFGGSPVFTRTEFMALVGPKDVDALGMNIAMLRRIGVNTVQLKSKDIPALQPCLAVD